MGWVEYGYTAKRYNFLPLAQINCAESGFSTTVLSLVDFVNKLVTGCPGITGGVPGQSDASTTKNRC